MSRLASLGEPQVNLAGYGLGQAFTMQEWEKSIESTSVLFLLMMYSEEDPVGDDYSVKFPEIQ